MSDFTKNLIEVNKELESLYSEKRIMLERKNLELNDKKRHNDLIALKDKQFNIEKEIKIYQSEIDKFNTSKEKLKNEITLINKKVFDYKSNRKQIEDDLRKKLREEMNLNNELSIKLSNVKDNRFMPNSVRSILNNPRLQVLGTIENLITMDSKYITACSYSLMSSMTNIVVENENIANEAIDYLKKNNLGRATFLPINKLVAKFVDNASIKKIENVLGYKGILSDLITYDKKYLNVIKHLTGNIIVAKDSITATKISNLINKKYRVISLDGTLVNTSGSITGGQSKVNNNINIIHEIDNIKKAINIIEREITDLEKEINHNDYSISNIEEKYKELNSKLISIEENISVKKSRIELCNRELKATKNDINSNESNDLQQLEIDILKLIYVTEEKKDKLNLNLKNSQEEKDDINSLILVAETNIKNITLEINSNEKKLNNLIVEININNSKLDNLLNLLNEKYSITYEKASSVYNIIEDIEEIRIEVINLKKEINSLGFVNIESIVEYEQVKERYDFLTSQINDLEKAKETLFEIIKKMDEIMEKEFINTFNKIKVEFEHIFKKLFGSGNASLTLTNKEDLLNTGIEINANPGGKKLSSISLLSGGEQTLTTMSLLFAIIKVRKTPFCILDEIEAALDESNVDLFGQFLETFRGTTQFILITHKKKTMEYVDRLYGVTMVESGISKLVSVKLEK
ncbi:MAG: hypothetical protein ACK5HL_02280 [Bacilli bacterium]